MARRKLLAGLAFGAVSATGAALFRRRARRRARIEIYFADGSIVALDQRSPEAARPFGLARQALAAARGQ